MTKQIKTFTAGRSMKLDLEVGEEYVIMKKSELDTYAMEFLKECLPEEVGQNVIFNKISRGKMNEANFDNGYNSCRRQTLNNANNKQDEVSM